MRRLLLLFSLAAAGCSADLPPEYRIEDLRLLAVRASEPELLFESLSRAQTRFEALVVDPRGGAVAVRWQLCPVESEHACADFARLRDEAPEEHRAGLDTLRAIEASGVAELEPGADGAVRPYAVPPFDLDADASLVTYHAATSYLGYTTGAWPSVQLEVRRPDGEAVFGTKRFVLNVRDPSLFADELEERAGLRVCDADTTEECLAIAPRTPNQNPTLARVLVARSHDASAPFEEVSGPIAVRAEEELRLRPELDPAALEPYEALRRDPDTGRVFVEAAVEEPELQWFVTAGSLWRHVTWPPNTKNHDNVFTAPAGLPAERSGHMTLWIVVRDRRGGTSWSSVELVLTP